MILNWEENPPQEHSKDRSWHAAISPSEHFSVLDRMTGFGCRDIESAYVRYSEPGADGKVTRLEFILATSFDLRFHNKPEDTLETLKHKLRLKGAWWQDPRTTVANRPSWALGCPFCGHEPRQDFTAHPDLWTVACHNGECDAMPEVHSKESAEGAIVAWNRRAP